MASKSKRRRKVLGASCILAALIIAGSSFAWFTSKDEVVNRLSSSADYGVSIAESFQPPENWVPGQEVNKDAFATNTGNVDAFVRMYLEGNMRLLTQKKDSANTNAKAFGASAVNVGSLTDVVDTNLLNANLTKLDANGNYFKTLDKTQTTNPNTSISTNNAGYAGNENSQNTITGPMSEVQSMQSGILAYAPSDAKYSYVLDQETELEIYMTSTVNNESTPSTGYRKVQVPAGTLVIVGDSSPNAATLTGGVLTPYSTDVTVTSSSGATKTYSSTVYVQSQTHDDTTKFFVPQNVEYESFTPMTDGLYLFLRDEENANQSDPEFSGYYVDGIDDTGETPATGTYYALNTGIADTSGTAPTYRSDYTVKGATSADYDHPVAVGYDANNKNIIKVVPTTNLELFNAQYGSVISSDLKWYYDDTATKERMIALYDKDSDGAFDAADDIAVIINFANIGTAADKWTAINGTTGTAAAISDMKDYDAASGNISALAMNNTPENLKFYYTNDLESGDTTVKLVDKVKLYEGVKNTAYLAFDFNLNVKLDSVQVTYDENGKEADTAVALNKGEEFKADANTGGATGLAAVTGKEITSVAWAKTT